MLQKIEYAGANAVSFKQAEEHLKQLADFGISDMHIQRITERLGAERQKLRDEEVEQMKQDKLKERHLNRPQVAVIHIDAGKVQMRQDDGKGPGVREPAWADTKVSCLLTYQGTPHEEDPQPEPPKKLTEPDAVKQLCREMTRIHGKSESREDQDKAQEAMPKEDGGEKEQTEVIKPEPLVRTAVATQEKTEAFGYMVAAEAKKRGFYEAERRAVISDAGNWINPLADLHFPGFVQILDFLHLLVHLYAGAQAALGKETKKAWVLYLRLIHQAWKGQVGDLMKTLERHVERIGRPSEEASDGDPCKILFLVLEFVRKNGYRMDYPSYRKAGLPISSAPVESLIKQFNQRVKGTEKFWHKDRVEAILQSRAAYLSQDRRAEEFWEKRQSVGRAVGQNRLRRTVADALT